MPDSLDRRNFLKLAGLTGVAGTTGCGTQQAAKLISLTVPPEQVPLGESIWYATTCRECPAGCGVMARAQDGRVTKVEGNPRHPINEGGLCIRGQASVQGLYNPDRFRQPLARSAGALELVSWEQAEAQVAVRLRELASDGRTNQIAFLSGHNGPAMDSLVRGWMAAFSSNRYLVYEPFSPAPLREANRLAFGREAVPDYRIAESDYLISFGADFLETWISPVGYSRGFARMREVSPDGGRGKFVQVEPRLSMTGANADEWIAIRPGGETLLALSMARTILSEQLGALPPPVERRRLETLLAPFTPGQVSASVDLPPETIERLAREFAAARKGIALGGGVGVSGEDSTAALLAIQLLNYVTGRVGDTVRFDGARRLVATASAGEIGELVESMNRGEVEVLFLHHANPVFLLPPETGFAAALGKVPLVVSFSSFPDETTALAHVVLPDHTPLEQWGDESPSRGVHSLMQPAMNPVFDTKPAGDVLLGLARAVGLSVESVLGEGASGNETFQDYLRQSWREAHKEQAGGDFDQFWHDCLVRGGHWDSTADDTEGKPVERVRLSDEVFDFAFAPPQSENAADFFLHVYPSSRFYDGRGANRPWLQEIPDPITKIAWNSWVEIHPETAARLGVAEGDLVAVESAAGRLEAPAYLYAGLRQDTVAIPLGQGHEGFGRYATGRGVNPARLLPARADGASGGLAWAGVSVKLSRAEGSARLARTDGSLTDLGRGFAQVIPLSVLTGESPPEPAAERETSRAYPELYPPHEHEDYRWGMAINLSSCTGCSACVAACYAENNIPVVGELEVSRGRSMDWLRIERYMEEISPAPDIRFSPMMCQQCDNAPCEPVCPVNATMHSPEGLNVQVYNRCVGTRYCSNNCPYKVRAFNWFDYGFEEPLNLQLNPEVSVRSKGIMEKCTFCIQRIHSAKDHARNEGRKVLDGEATPACAQSCPTQAIVFGNLLDPDSNVSRLSAKQHGYRVLEELNTKPAVTYLPKVRLD